MLHGQDTRGYWWLTDLFVYIDYNGRSGVRAACFIGLVVVSFERGRLFFGTRDVITTTIRDIKISASRIACSQGYYVRGSVGGFVRSFATRDGLYTSKRAFAGLGIHCKFSYATDGDLLANGFTWVVGSDIGCLYIIFDFTYYCIGCSFVRLQGLRGTLVTRLFRGHQYCQYFVFVDWY